MFIREKILKNKTWLQNMNLHNEQLISQEDKIICDLPENIDSHRQKTVKSSKYSNKNV